MNKEKVLINYFDSKQYNNQEILESVEQTKKEFEKKIDTLVENRIAERCLRNGQRKDARKHAGKAWKIRHTKVSVMLVIASLFPYSAVVKIRSMIKSKNLYWRIKKMWS